MRVFILVVIFSLSAFATRAQPNLAKIADSIEHAGKQLAQLELTAWASSDFFLQNYPGSRDNIGGYFTYPDKGLITCIYFSREANPKVIGTLSFSSPEKDPVKISVKPRNFNPSELQLFQMRKAAVAATGKDKFFTNYNNAQLNYIPVIDKGIRKLYITTSTDMYGAMILGNDYELVMDGKNTISSKKKLHNGIIIIDYVKEEGAKATTSKHTHDNTAGDFMSITDICQLMLNEKFTKWKEHYTISGKYVSVWDCKKDKLSILPRAVWEKSGKNKGK